MALTAGFVKMPDGGFSAFVEEIPGANTQGATIEDAKEDLREAVAIVLDANRELAEQAMAMRKSDSEPA